MAVPQWENTTIHHTGTLHLIYECTGTHCETISSKSVCHVSHHIKAQYLFICQIGLRRTSTDCLHTAHNQTFNQEENPACLTNEVRWALESTKELQGKRKTSSFLCRAVCPCVCTGHGNHAGVCVPCTHVQISFIVKVQSSSASYCSLWIPSMPLFW